MGTLGRTLVISNGEFGERLYDVTKLHTDKVDHLQFRWQAAIDLGRVEKLLSARRYTLVAMVHHETSTGMLNPVAEITRLAHAYGAYVSVDAVSSIGAELIQMQGWGVDILVGASGKALSAMPGVGIVVVREDVLTALESHVPRVHYLDLVRLFHFMNTYTQTPNTPAVPIFVSLHAALKELSEKGIIYARRTIEYRARLVRRELLDMGLSYIDYGSINSSVITCVPLPPQLSFTVLSERLKSKGIVVYNGKGILKDKIFQIGHIGALRPKDTRKALREIRQVTRKYVSQPQANAPFSRHFARSRSHVVS
ncbi:MAG: aminotransferase class V-fold PLP-dependent enzyme [Candidatus Saccharibacteria bacterium]